MEVIEMTEMEKLESKISGLMETSLFCRGELCRSLEPEVDRLGYKLSSVCSSEKTCATDKVTNLENKIRNTYKHIPSGSYF